MPASKHAVVIAGAGPTGLTLAAELKLAQVDVVLVERRLNQEINGSRAGGLQSRTIEVFDQRGIADRFLREGEALQVAGFANVSLDISDFPTRHPYGLALWQKHVERILLGWAEELAVPILRGVEVTGFTDGETHLDVQLGTGEVLRAQYLVGCDGGRSTVRKAAGIAFVGSDATVSHLLAEAEFTTEAQWGLRNDRHGLHSLSKIEDGKVRVLVTEADANRTDAPTLEDLRQALIAIYGTDYGIHSPVSISRFTDMARQAESYRRGRVLLAGDAAHVHYPAGGQGLNLGVQDAVNLGWKLAQVVNGTTPAAILDSYQAERHPIAAGVLRDTMASVALGRQDDRSKALSSVVTELVSMEGPRTYLGGRMSGLAVHYSFGEGHPLLGRRIPDLELVTAKGRQRIFSLLHQARPALLNFGAPGSLDIAPRGNRVIAIDAKCEGPWELPVVGAVPPPGAVLIRPDGYVAWVGDGTPAGLNDALVTWFGPGTA